MKNGPHSIHGILRSAWPFYLLLAVNLIIPFFTHFYPTLDGPAHLHNAQLLKAYWLGNEAVRANYELLQVPTPNWLDHVILGSFLFVFPAWLAEKALVLLYIIGMACGFRKMVCSISPQNVGFSLLIFPLITSYLFNLGFFNFSLGIMLYFWLVFIWVRNEQHRSRRIIGSALVALLLYFSNALAFALAGATVASYILHRSWLGRSKLKDISDAWHMVRKGIVDMLLVFGPGTLLFLIFIQHTEFGSVDPTRPASELLIWLLKMRPVIWFDDDLQWIIGVACFLLCSTIVMHRLFRFRKGNRNGAFLLLPLALILLLYFLTPDSAQAGVMNDRYCWMALVIFIGWTAVSAIPSRFTLVIPALVGLLQISLVLIHWNGMRKDLDHDAVAMKEAADHIPAGSTVYVADLSMHWMQIHLSNYLGVDKPLIILENYEARLDWFPLLWAEGRVEQACLTDWSAYGVRCDEEPMTNAELPEYVVVHGGSGKLDTVGTDGLQASLDRDYSEVRLRSNEGIELYRRK